MARLQPPKPMARIRNLKVILRFLSHVIHDVDSACWLWTGHRNSQGYGRFKLYEDGKWRTVFAHRVAYAIFKRKLRDGMTVDHRCKRRRCVNPDHLILVSISDNCSDGARCWNEKRRNNIGMHEPEEVPF